MNEIPPKRRPSRRRSRWLYLAFGFVAVALFIFVRFAHPFLAVTQRVDADILVVEGWIPDYMLPPAAKEFHEGKYARLLVSGLENDPKANSADSVSVALRMVSRLEELGVPPDALMACPAPFTGWRRTSKTAQAVKTKTAEVGIAIKGINVVTAGPHARETWVAYRHVFGETMPVGIISIPKTNYPADRWWLSAQGLYWVPKDFVAWLKEVVFGLRS